MRQIIYDKVKYIADKYKGYIDTEDLMKEGLTNRQIGLLTAEGKLEKVAHGHYWIISPEFSKPEDYKAVEVARVNRKVYEWKRIKRINGYNIHIDICLFIY